MTDVAVPRSATQRQALALAVAAAGRGPGGRTNPRVGCVILAPGHQDSLAIPARRILGIGWHRGAGTAHAEVDAIANASRGGAYDLTGATAIVTLQPCNSTGRTGPCAQALVEAGITTVRYAVVDPAADSAGSDAFLKAHGIDVAGPREFPLESASDSAIRQQDTAPAAQLVQAWLAAQKLGRPYVTLKTATTLDGRIAAPDGTSQWITGPEARAHAHQVRGEVGAILVGSGTVAADDPTLTARRPSGELAEHQPVRVVLGHSDIPADANLHGPGGELVHIRSHEPAAALTTLAADGVTHVLVEGGARVSAAFLRARLVDEIHAYIAPKLLGDGIAATAPFGVTTLRDAAEFEFLSPHRLGGDVLLTARRSGPLDPSEGK